MTPLDSTTSALRAATDALRTGSAVVLPNPHPLTSIVAATTPEVVNRAKGRPADQAVALWLVTDDHWAEFASAVDLDTTTLGLARELLVCERLTLLLPVANTDCLGWARQAIRDDHALVFAGCWDPLRHILDDVGHLHVSSANRTGQAPAASAAQARAMFPAEVHVLDAADGLPAAGRHATTTVRLGSRRTATHTRSGAQDHGHGGPDAYLAYLRTTYDTA